MLAAVLVVGVNGINEINAIQNVEGCGVASAYTEHNEVLALLASVDDLDLLALHLELHQVLGLGEEEVLCGTGGVELLGHLNALIPLLELGAGSRVNGKVDSSVLGKRGKECLKLVSSKHLH